MQADMFGYITPVFNYPKTGPFSHNGLLVAVTKCHKDVQKVPSNFIACSKKPKQNDVLPAGRNWHRKPIFMWFFYFFINIAYDFSSLTVYRYLFYFHYQFIHIYFLKYISKCVIIIDRCSTPATSKMYIFVTEAVISFKLQLCPWQLKQLACECMHVCQLPTFRLQTFLPVCYSETFCS